MSRHEQLTVGELFWCGIYQKVGTHSVYILARNAAGYVMVCAGSAVPHDADAGFATGCIFIKTDAGTIYLNAGTAASANFDLLGTAIGAGGISDAELAANSVIAAKIAAGSVGQSKMAVLTKNAEATDDHITVLAADLLTGYMKKGTTTGAKNITLDTAVNIQAAFNATAGAWFVWKIYNNSSAAQTLTTAAGLTLLGLAAVPNGKVATVTFVNTGAGTMDVLIQVSA